MTNPKVFFTNKELRDAEAGIKPLPRSEDMIESEHLCREVLSGAERIAQAGLADKAAASGLGLNLTLPLRHKDSD